jgi:hypothetical protein
MSGVEDKLSTIESVDRLHPRAPWYRWLRVSVMAVALGVPLVMAAGLILRSLSDRGDRLLIRAEQGTPEVQTTAADTGSNASGFSVPPVLTTDDVRIPGPDDGTDSSLPGPVYAEPPTCSLLAPIGAGLGDPTCPRGRAWQSEIDWYTCLTEHGLPAGMDRPDAVAVSPEVAVAAEAACQEVRAPMALMIIGSYGECMRQQGQFFIPGAVVEGFAEAREWCRSQLPPPPFPPETLAYHACLREAGFEINGPLPGDPAPDGPPSLEAPRAAGAACRHLMVGFSANPPDEYTNCMADHGIYLQILGVRWEGSEMVIAEQRCRAQLGWPTIPTPPTDGTTLPGGTTPR